MIPIKDDKELEHFKSQLKIRDLEKELLKLDPVECPVEHDFADGVYIRKTRMPKGTFAIGKRHRYRTYNILLEGEITVYQGEHVPVKRIKAPACFVSDAGVKKMAFFHEDTVWINVHPTTETDLVKIEDQFIIPDDDYFIDVTNEGDQKWLG